MTKHHLSILVAALFGLFALGSTDDAPPSSTMTDTVSTSPATAATSSTLTKDDYLAQLDREIASIRTFDGSKYRGDKDAINMEVILFSVWAKVIADSTSYSLSPIEKKKARELRRLVSQTQIREFPRMRAAWARVVGAAMWEHDVTITSHGEGARTIRLTAAMFASNGNIKQVQQSLQEQFGLLRFRRAEYRWFRGADEYTYYSIEGPRDGEVRQITTSGWER